MYQKQKNNNSQMRMNVKVSRNPVEYAKERNKEKLKYEVIKFYREVEKSGERKFANRRASGDGDC